MEDIVQITNSIMKYFNIAPLHITSETVDKYMENKEYTNVIELVVDGMGYFNMFNLLSQDGFLCINVKKKLNTVFPPTTVAAMTSVETGLYPCEHSWLGWDCYYPALDKNVSVFSNKISGTDIDAADFDVANTYCPFESVSKKIEKQGFEVYQLSAIEKKCSANISVVPENFHDICSMISEICKTKSRKFIYAYWHELDHVMHLYGNDSTEAANELQNVENEIKRLVNELEDTLFVITADHGHTNCKGVYLQDYPKICDCLLREPSIEARARSFFVKDEKKEQFEEEFQKEFGKEFLLLSRKQVLEQQIFGPGKEHRMFGEMLGDYLAIATGELAICSDPMFAEKMVSTHAGGTKREKEIPLIILEK